MRAFLALPLTQLFESEVATLIQNLKKKYPGPRWVKSSEIHITLHFFGDIAPEDVSKISKCVIPVTEEVRSFSIHLKGIGAFPNTHQPRVIWTGLEGEIKPLADMQAALEKNLKKVGFPMEKREFKPHLTLARVKTRGDFGGLEGEKFGPTVSKRVSEIVLFQSRLTPEGAHYDVVETYPLSQA
ncbi:MAG: RNA 2',3'-cyclic phosphodiesterase [Candidatus Omnitrophica bacterium]|nr:RNA 2',3'-cyclic phosphodiesterase [Candidatus Omnitrophota bacterium]